MFPHNWCHRQYDNHTTFATRIRTFCIIGPWHGLYDLESQISRMFRGHGWRLWVHKECKIWRCGRKFRFFALHEETHHFYDYVCSVHGSIRLQTSTVYLFCVSWICRLDILHLHCKFGITYGAHFLPAPFFFLVSHVLKHCKQISQPSSSTNLHIRVLYTHPHAHSSQWNQSNGTLAPFSLSTNHNKRIILQIPIVPASSCNSTPCVCKYVNMQQSSI